MKAIRENLKVNDKITFTNKFNFTTVYRIVEFGKNRVKVDTGFHHTWLGYKTISKFDIC